MNVFYTHPVPIKLGCSVKKSNIFYLINLYFIHRWAIQKTKHPLSFFLNKSVNIYCRSGDQLLEVLGEMFL